MTSNSEDLDRLAETINKEKQRKQRNTILAVFGVGLVAIILFGSKVDNEKREASAPTASPATPTPRTSLPIRYEVTGRPVHASITYHNADGGTSQVSKAEVPWTLDFQAKPGTFLYLSAQEGSGNEKSAITATIYVDGFKFKSSTSAGAYVIATASGSVPKP